jgi:hypothetical protein
MSRTRDEALAVGCPVLTFLVSLMCDSGSADGKIVLFRLESLEYFRSFKDADQGIQVGAETHRNHTESVTGSDLVFSSLTPEGLTVVIARVLGVGSRWWRRRVCFSRA